MERSHLESIIDRELRTVVRTRTFLVLSLGFTAVVLGLAWVGGTTGFVPVILTLLMPMEVLVPALALAFGYRAVLDDARRGELDVLRTYPVSRSEFVLGVYLGRAAALLVAVLVPLLLAGLMTAVLSGTRSTVFVAHGGADSVLLYLRFVVLTAAFAAVALAVALVVSTAVRTLRGAIAAGTALLIVIVVGLDLGLVAGLAGGVIPDGLLQFLLALSPNSAYRGLVLELVIGPVGLGGARHAPAAANLVGLGIWLAGALAMAAWTVWRGRARA